MTKPRDRLRIRVQKSGRLSEPSQDLLARCGLKFRQSRDKLFCFGESFPIDLLLVRDDDIPGLIAQGVCELGIVGRNVASEQRIEAESRGEAAFAEIRELGSDAAACRSRCPRKIATTARKTWPDSASPPATRTCWAPICASMGWRPISSYSTARSRSRRAWVRRMILRSGAVRRHAGRQPVARSGIDPRKRGGADRRAPGLRRRARRTARIAAAAHRWRHPRARIQAGAVPGGSGTSGRVRPRQ